MKVVHYLLITVGFLNLTCNNSKVDFDYIIVGGGLAGLSAAKELNSDNVLIIEKDSVFGGRVKTSNYQKKYYYDLGAVFALDTNYRSNLNIDYSEFVENGKVGFWIDNKLYDGNTILECLEKIPNLDFLNIKNLSQEKTFNSALLDPYTYDILNTNMKAVFPGALNNYNNILQKFSFERYNSSHFVQGNAIVVDYYLKNAKFSHQLSTEVLSVRELNGKVEVICLSKGIIDTLFAKKVIVASTASVAKKIIKEINPDCKKFLNGIKYAGYYSIAIGVNKEIKKNQVAYLMPVNSGFSSIIKQKTSDPNVTIFQLYIAEEDMDKFENEKEIREKSISVLNDIWDVNEHEVMFYDQYLWKEAGVLINNHYLGKWSDDNLKAGKNIFLAGDYCLIHFDTPYGMIPAIESGRQAAKSLK